MPKILMRRDTLANWRSTNPTLLAGEWGFETDTKRIKIGNGVDAYNDLDYWRESDNVWEPEAEWIDMRSACLPNSIYFLVAHGNATESSGTYSISLYPTFGVSAVLSGGDSSTYDVFVDGLKVGTYASGDDAILDWEALYNADKVEDAFAITYPATLMSHVVRVTPTNSSHTFTQIGAGKGITEDDSGLIWVHVSTNARISYGSFLDTADNGNPLLEAVTANDNVLYCSNLDSAFRGNAGLKSVPIIDGADESELDIDEAFKGCTAMKRVTFQNVDSNSTGTFDDCTNLKVINGDGCTFNPDFNNVPALKALPGTMKIGPDRTEISLSNVAGLKDTALDFSSESQLDKLTITGNDNQNAGLIGLTVSSDAEFGSLIEPQIDIHNTNMIRSALVGLFESMPYNVAYEKVGNPTIVDGVASGFSENDYIQLNSAINFGNNFEIVIKLIGPSNNPNKTYQYLFSNSGGTSTTGFYGLMLYLNSGRYIQFNSTTSGTSWDITMTSDLGSVINEGDSLYVKLAYDGTAYSYYKSSDGVSWVLLKREEFGAPVNSSVLPLFGRNAPYATDAVYPGSIDLNETYIKVNGIPWFGPGATRNMKPSGEIVGSPTIVDGILFNTNGANYIESTSLLKLVEPFELQMRFLKTDVRTRLLNFGDLWMSVYSINDYNVVLEMPANTYSTGIVVQIGLWHILRLVSDGSTLTLSIKPEESGSFSSVSLSIPSSYSGARSMKFGRAYNPSETSIGNCQIDLNNTYIKVGSDYVYRGMVPATKRISVAGCSGTSSLSPEDKAIVTDKNWALTIS